MDAQACFDRMIKNVVGPGFRAMGFRGSGRNFYLPDTGGHHALMALAKSRYNWRESCRFSITLTFWSEQDWAAARRDFPELKAKRPAVHTVYGRSLPTWSVDVGELLDPPHGHSWTLSGPEDVPAIADHVLTVVAETALPALRALAAGGDPPPLPPSDRRFDCPWPYCTNPTDRYDDELDLDAVPEPEPAPKLSADDLDALARAELIVVPRKIAWRLLHISRSRLDMFADILGAADDLALPAMFTMALLCVDGEYIEAAAWRSAHSAVAEWLTDPHQASEARLWVSDNGARLTPEFPADIHGLCVTGVLDRLRDLLRELEGRQLI